MLTYLKNLSDLFSKRINNDLNNWIVSNPVHYANKLCEFTNNVNNEMINISINTFTNFNSSNFWKEEIHYDRSIQREVIEQDILRNQIQRLIDDDAHEYEWSKLSDEDLIKMANELFSRDFHYDIISDINAFEISRKRVKYYKRQKGKFLKRKRRSLLNFREVFRKLYSFHFKNLDDEHNLAYTNLGMIS